MFAALPESEHVAGASFDRDKFTFAGKIVAVGNPLQRGFSFELDPGPTCRDARGHTVLKNGVHDSSFFVER